MLTVFRGLHLLRVAFCQGNRKRNKWKRVACRDLETGSYIIQKRKPERWPSG